MRDFRTRVNPTYCLDWSDRRLSRRLYALAIHIVLIGADIVPIEFGHVL